MIWYDTTMRDGGQPSFGDQVFERLLRERIVFLGTEVTEESANQICAQILLLAAEDADSDIFLYINSPGGSVSAGMAVYDTMRYVRNDVATLALGFAGSMGQFLLCAGAAGKRYALPHSRIMMHQPSGGMGGTAADITIQAENMLHVKRTMQELIAQHSGRMLDEIQRDWDRDRWFTAEQAREYGLVDQVLTRAEQLPAA
ncbi:ClpP family protease [Micromonospora taraxaci]